MPESKPDKIAEVQSKLPLPEQPPQASDWQSADRRQTDEAGADTSGGGSGKGADAGLGGADVDTSGIGREAAKKA
ncbi:tubulin gamma chain [Ophiocordyceps camponoti-floridani]|uniref:Tubulin gamma chain n=1 Tax=Ophiocordyceps camponoti-floridani TaxID=2030778 RepID=A0A8H4QCR6_9HYPO|nr:tubulin gamma chain [Ophiocordyceps camponoti-floridani]